MQAALQASTIRLLINRAGLAAIYVALKTCKEEQDEA